MKNNSVDKEEDDNEEVGMFEPGKESQEDEIIWGFILLVHVLIQMFYSNWNIAEAK